jgi:hypothetical protein
LKFCMYFHLICAQGVSQKVMFTGIFLCDIRFHVPSPMAFARGCDGKGLYSISFWSL